jgi:NADH:ubiquinone oxidoreductase subunit 5 (subunit L)/multisubunit Na+/H+ antiporter MnhA subunit
LGWWLYSRRRSAADLDPIQTIPVIGRPVWAILYNKYYFDEIYRGLIIYPVVSLATLCAKFDYDWVINRIVDTFGRLTTLVADGSGAFDQYGVDGYFVNGIPGVFNWLGGQLRLLQTGRAQNYLLILVVGLLLLVALYLLISTGQVAGVAALPTS